jgi:TPR repeat protein
VENVKKKIIALFFMVFSLCLQCVVPAYTATHSNSSTLSLDEIQQEAIKGKAQAQYNLGRRYQNGEGVPQDDKKAVELYTKAAEQGNANAQYNLGVMYQNGEGVPQDTKKAVDLITMAAKQGFAWAQYTLGVIYQNGENVPQDNKKALEWYNKAAEKGNAKAQFTLGLIYENREHEVKKAVDLYTKAAEQGYATPQYNLRWTHQKGDVMPQDKKKAVELYTKAAEQGYATAQFFLGWMYFGGIGTEKNEKDAYKWWTQAAKQGNENAQKNVDILCRMTPWACKSDSANPEFEMWSLVKGSGNLADVDTFLGKYPQGQYAGAARLLRDQLLRPKKAPVGQPEVKKKDTTSQSTAVVPPSPVPVEGATLRDSVTGMEFVYVPGGCFQMGDTFGDGQSNERPVHEVCVDGFYIGKYEVTQDEYTNVTGFNPSDPKKGGSYPVENIVWNDIDKFIRKLKERSGKNYRLPTEAEWEYAACSGGRKEKFAGSDDVDAVAWYVGNSSRSTHPVGQKQPNGLGLHDMSGNVWEWCSDRYDDNYYKVSVKDNPTGPASGYYDNILRGGSWQGGAMEQRSTYRFKRHWSTLDVGFRLVLPAQRP